MTAMSRADQSGVECGANLLVAFQRLFVGSHGRTLSPTTPFPIRNDGASASLRQKRPRAPGSGFFDAEAPFEADF